MRAILSHCGDIPSEQVSGGTVLLEEGQNTGRVYVLAQGRIEALRGDTQGNFEFHASRRVQRVGAAAVLEIGNFGNCRLKGGDGALYILRLDENRRVERKP